MASTSASGPSAYYGPRGIAVAPSGAVYLADTGNHRVRKFTPEGVEQLSWGGLGKEPGQFTEPVGIAVDKDGHVYVVDNGNARVQIFDPDGKLLSAFPVDGWEQKVFSEPHVTIAPGRHHLGQRAPAARPARVRSQRQAPAGDQGRRRAAPAFRPPDGLGVRPADEGAGRRRPREPGRAGAGEVTPAQKLRDR